MKNLFRFVLVLALLLPLQVFSQTNQKVVFNNNEVYGANIQWYKADTTNSASPDVFYYGSNDSLSVVGYYTDADTFISCVYAFKDINSIQYVTKDGKVVADPSAVKSFQVIVQVANSGEYYKDPWNMPDSLFKDWYWLNTASGIDVVSMSSASVDDYEVSEPFLIPPLGSKFMRCVVITDATHADTTDLRLQLDQRNTR